MSGRRRTATHIAATLAALWHGAAMAHAFPEHEEPGVGAVVHQAPKQVIIRFDSRVEPAFSNLIIKDASGKQFAIASHVDNDSHQSLEADLPPLAPGKYHVYWKVVSRDGHPTEGDYIFEVRP